MGSTVNAAELNYAESVAMSGHAADGATTFDVRIARFPAQARGTLWFYVYINGQHYSLVDELVQLADPNPIAVLEPDATFTVTGSSSARLSGQARYQPNMRGELDASGRLHAVAHPTVGVGTIPVELNATFSAQHAPISVRAGRIEVMGEIRGQVTIDGVSHDFVLPGKWHEQTGPRANFAPAFTYLFVQGEGLGLMATSHTAGAWGYVFQKSATLAVTTMQIDPYGGQERRFTATLENGEQVRGRAQVLREVSVPIEGKRRPGATVIVDSDIGRMVGVLNDWQPNEAP